MSGAGVVAFVRRHWALLAVIAVAVVARWAFLVGLVGSDDTRYINSAVELAQGHPPERLDHANTRAAFLVWLAAWNTVGVTASQLPNVALVVDALQAAALYWVARELTGHPLSAALAACAWVVFPVELVQEGGVSPDDPAMALALAAVGLALVSARQEASSPARRGMLAAGAVAGLAFSAKEPFLLVPVILSGWIAVSGRPRREAVIHVAAVWLGFGLVFALEHAFFALWTGDWLYKYHALAGAYGPQGSERFAVTPGVFFYYIQHVLADFHVSGLFGWLLLAATLATGRTLRHRLLIVTWTATFYLVLQFGSTSLTEYRRFPMQARYVAPIIVLLFSALGATVHELARGSVLRVAGTAALVLGIVLQSFGVARDRIASGIYLADVPESAIALLKRPGDVPPVIYVPVGYRARLPIDLQHATATWREVDLDTWLQADSAGAHASACAVLEPASLPFLMRSPARAARVAAELEARGSSSLVLSYPITPLDRLIERAPLGPLRALARHRVAARVWLIEATGT